MDELEQAQQIMNDLENKLGKEKIFSECSDVLKKTYDDIWVIEAENIFSREIENIPIDLESAEYIKKEMGK